MESEIADKINELFKDSKEDEKRLEDCGIVDPTSKFEFEDLSLRDKKEVETYLKKLHAQLPKKPRQFWKWSFTGRLILKIAIYFIEFFILFLLFYFVLPYAINTSVELVQASCLCVICSYLRYWFK